jgi:hypothetical protein
MTCAECQKGKKKQFWPLFRIYCVCVVCVSALLLQLLLPPFLGLGGVFVGGEMCICVPLRVLISRACSNNICCDTAFFRISLFAPSIISPVP